MRHTFINQLFPEGSLEPYAFIASYGGGDGDVSSSQNLHFNPNPGAWLAINSFI